MTQLTIDSISRGEGVATLTSGKRVFVPGAAPGDRVEIELTEERSRHARARLLRVLEPGPDRVDPACRHALVCGGCQLQHLRYQAQLAGKEKGFYELVARVGGLEGAALGEARPILASPTPLRYRTRCRVHVRGKTLGYLTRGSHDLVAIAECPQVVEPLERVLLALSAELQRRPFPNLAAIDACTGADGAVALGLEPAPGAPAGWGSQAGWFLSVPGVTGIVIRAAQAERPRRAAPGTVVATVLGDPVVRRPAPCAPALQLLGSPDVFAQANAQAVDRLAALALADLQVRPGDEVIELFAGAGTFTLALAASGARVTAVESHGPALSLARRALEGSGLSVRSIEADAAQAAADLVARGKRFDLALLDPPRAGARELLPALVKLEPRRILYMSCDPGTLARDLKDLTTLGYKVRAVTPVDMFPQTFHVEAAVALER